MCGCREKDGSIAAGFIINFLKLRLFFFNFSFSFKAYDMKCLHNN